MEWHLIEVEKERWTECLVGRVELVDKIAWMDMVVADMAVGGRELCHGSGGNCWDIQLDGGFGGGCDHILPVM